jgi:hypothetical protein
MTFTTIDEVSTTTTIAAGVLTEPCSTPGAAGSP